MTTPLRPELIIEGRIMTLAGKDGFGWAGALAIGHGRVLAAGAPEEIVPLAARGTRHWRLAPDELAMPGITDAHLHLLALALAEGQVDLSDVRDADATAALLVAAHEQRRRDGDTDGWLLGHGWSLDRLGNWPDADRLEGLVPDRPAALWAHDHHSRWLNRTALRLAGITAGTADPAGGLIRRDADGIPTGLLHEKAAVLVDRAIPPPDEVQLETALASVSDRLLELGVTACHDPGLLDARVDLSLGPMFYRSLAERDRLSLRVHASVRTGQLDAAIEAGLRSGEGIGRYTMGWLKLFADGSLGSRSAALLTPYDDAGLNPPTGGPAGMFLSPPEELAHDLRRAAAAGISGQVHAIGDAAVRLALDLLAELPAGPLPHRIEHAQLVDPSDVPRFGRLGIVASVQPVHLRSDAVAAVAAWGDRAEHAFPLASLSAGGALIPFGTDAPVEPPDPWPGIAVALARRDPLSSHASRLGAGQALPLARAIRAACLDPARTAGQRDVGRLTAGCRADLLIVPAAPFGDHDPATLARLRPRATLLDGQLVHGEAG